jgi:hypothetical protein
MEPSEVATGAITMKTIDANNTTRMEQEPADTLIELGTVSVETRGNFAGVSIEGAGLPFRLD